MRSASSCACPGSRGSEWTSERSRCSNRGGSIGTLDQGEGVTDGTRRGTSSVVVAENKGASVGKVQHRVTVVDLVKEGSDVEGDVSG